MRPETDSLLIDDWLSSVHAEARRTIVPLEDAADFWNHRGKSICRIQSRIGDRRQSSSVYGKIGYDNE